MSDQVRQAINQIAWACIVEGREREKARRKQELDAAFGRWREEDQRKAQGSESSEQPGQGTTPPPPDAGNKPNGQENNNSFLMELGNEVKKSFGQRFGGGKSTESNQPQGLFGGDGNGGARRKPALRLPR